MKSFSFRVGLSLGLLLLAVSVFGQGVFTVQLQPFLTGLSSPVFITHAKDGSRRLFVVQQRGLIKVVQPGSNTATDFLDLTGKVSQTGSERGLLGLAFHPQFATNSYFFVNYTRESDGATIIARYRAINNNSIGDPNSERIILTVPQPFSNHNGGMIEFRNDNGTHNLYIGMGDGGSANDPQNLAQNINSLLGKFLRITPDVSGNNSNPPYTIPADNPFVGAPGADEIYALGLRNPWRWSFDRVNPSQLWAADVGQNAIEEVDLITRGGNYGWRVYEGTQCTNLDPGLCNPNNYIAPVLQYSHTGGRCSVTGGYVYRGSRGTFPSGAYLYGDFCSGEVWIWFNNQIMGPFATGRMISSFGEDQDGELYLVGLNGTVDKFIPVRPNKTSADFDGDSRTDLTVFRPSSGAWYILNSSNAAFRAVQFGSNGDIPAPEDYDGDNITDIAVFRPSSGSWFLLLSSNGAFSGTQFGQNGDIPVAGDFDGDGRADLTVFRPSTGAWYRLNSSNGAFFAVAFGQNGDIPIAGDFDGDGRADITVFRPSTGAWYRLNSSNGAFSAVAFGTNGDIPAAGDFDGDGRLDHAVFRPSQGAWYILRSSDGGFQGVQWGIAEDIPVVGDYDGDGRDDIAVFRPSNGAWYVLLSSNGSLLARQFGQNGDLPAPKYDIP